MGVLVVNTTGQSTMITVACGFEIKWSWKYFSRESSSTIFSLYLTKDLTIIITTISVKIFGIICDFSPFQLIFIWSSFEIIASRFHYHENYISSWLCANPHPKSPPTNLFGKITSVEKCLSRQNCRNIISQGEIRSMNKKCLSPLLLYT